MFKKSESGRTLVEMMGVLIIIAVIILSSLFLFNTLFKSYQRRETVKQMDTIVTGYRSAELSMKRNGKVKLKNIVSGARSKNGVGTLDAANGGTFKVADQNIDGTFVIQTTNLGISCNDIVEEGNYTGVYAMNESGEKTEVYDPEKAKEVAALSAICGSQHQYFLYTRGSKGKPVGPGNGGDEGDGSGGGVDPDTPIIYSDCPSGQTRDKAGDCCEVGKIKCGLCGGCKDYPIGTKRYCDTTTNTCRECPHDQEEPTQACSTKTTLTAPAGCIPSTYTHYTVDDYCVCEKHDEEHTPKWKPDTDYIKGVNYFTNDEPSILKDGKTHCYNIKNCPYDAGKCDKPTCPDNKCCTSKTLYDAKDCPCTNYTETPCVCEAPWKKESEKPTCTGNTKLTEKTLKDGNKCYKCCPKGDFTDTELQNLTNDDKLYCVETHVMTSDGCPEYYTKKSNYNIDECHYCKKGKYETKKNDTRIGETCYKCFNGKRTPDNTITKGTCAKCQDGQWISTSDICHTCDLETGNQDWTKKDYTLVCPQQCCHNKTTCGRDGNCCPMSESKPQNYCSDPVVHPIFNNCKEYTTYSRRDCSCAIDAPQGQGYVASCTKGETYVADPTEGNDIKTLADNKTKCYKCTECPKGETKPSIGCYDVVSHEGPGDCPTYYTYTKKDCTCSGCNDCQSCDKNTGNCVANTSKNNQSCGTCGTCSSGTCVEGEILTATVKKYNGNCCESKTITYCKGQTKPTSNCTGNKTEEVASSTSSKHLGCTWYTRTKDLCTGALGSDIEHKGNGYVSNTCHAGNWCWGCYQGICQRCGWCRADGDMGAGNCSYY